VGGPYLNRGPPPPPENMLLRALTLSMLACAAVAQIPATGPHITVDGMQASRVFWLDAPSRQISYRILPATTTQKKFELVMDSGAVVASVDIGPVTTRSGSLSFKAATPQGFTPTTALNARFLIKGFATILESLPIALASARVAPSATVATRADGMLVLTVEATLSHPGFHTEFDRIVIQSPGGAARTCYLSTGTDAKAATKPAPKDRFACEFAFRKKLAGQTSEAPSVVAMLVTEDPNDIKAVAMVIPTSTQINAWKAAGI